MFKLPVAISRGTPAQKNEYTSLARRHENALGRARTAEEELAEMSGVGYQGLTTLVGGVTTMGMGKLDRKAGMGLPIGGFEVRPSFALGSITLIGGIAMKSPAACNIGRMWMAPSLYNVGYGPANG